MKLFSSLTTSFILMLNIAAVAQPILSYTAVITGLNSPMQMVHAGDGSKRIFIVQKDGTVLLYDKSYVLTGTFLTVTNISSSSERGLLSMVFHPAYATNGFFYVYYNNFAGDLELARYKASANANIADPASKVILKTIPHPNYSNHNGGELHFGNDGNLYLSTGDGGSAGDPSNNAQTTTVLLGKILRFAVNTSNTAPYYTIPASNPYGNEVYAVGLRNPFRWSFDRATYDMWIGDVGQDSYEEVNFRPADSALNVNYGWHCYEGVDVFAAGGCTLPNSVHTLPIYFYPTPNPAGAITGGRVYRGNTYIGFRGYYVATDFYTGNLFKVKYDSIAHTSTSSMQIPSPLVTGISDFGETEEGELFAVSLTANTVYRITSNGPIGYTFTGNGNWNIAANWSNETIPPTTLAAGAEIIIDPVANGECVLETAETISAGAKFILKNSKKFRIAGGLIIQ